ncbi:MAG: putative nicotinate-nucleotide adenylyltransferase [Promethearchaeota archaeon]|nr:MAG: putative nicotinate-nucleotide adenylyltransferase [Candidatus Lokiarchaeota archaeon]
MRDYQQRTDEVFRKHFGRTPLKMRLEDILGEAIELSRSTDLANLKEEAGDVLCSVLQLCTECSWDAQDLVQATLNKIEGRESQYQTLGRKKRVAILGGAFNPITKGHIQICQLVLNVARKFDEAWLMPCYAHMHGKEMVSAQHRLAMCELAAKVDGRIRVSSYEIDNKLSGETYHCMQKLMNEDFAKDEYEFSLIIGMDNANKFDKWVNYEHLEKLMPFVVVPRGGIERDESVDWYLKPPHVYIASEGDIINCSSSQVRTFLKRFLGTSNIENCNTGLLLARELDKMLDDNVYKYIEDNELYLP